MIPISDDLSLPLDAVTQTFGILAVRGAGKSNAAAVMAEGMFHHKLPFAVVDPVGAWYGLRSSADGKSPGLPIPVFGGRRGDVPLEKNAGQVIADLIVDERVSCVVDCSEFSENDKIHFLIDFSERLYRRNQNPLHLFLEEADDYCPQRPFREQARLLRAWENVVRRGRARGLGITMITQRSAAINKNVLTQIETLIVLRTTSPNDRKAIEGWVEYHGQGKELVQSLPELAAGEAWVWSPSWLKIMKRVKIHRRSTFDSGATPKSVTGHRPAATLADIDLGAIEKRMQATIERAKAEDPRELRRRIAELERALRDNPAAEPKTIEVPVLTAKDIDQLQRIAKAIADAGANTVEIGRAVREKLDAIAAAVSSARSVKKSPFHPPLAKGDRGGFEQRAKTGSNGDQAPGDLDDAQLRVLRAVRSLRDRNLPIDRVAVARWMGLHPNGGRYLGTLRQLKEAGLLDTDLHPTENTPAVSPLAADGPEGVLDLLDPPKRKIFEEILAQPAANREELAERLGLHPNGGRFLGNLRWLRDMGVVPDRGPLKATEGVYL
jgi:hypothetical protein